MITDFWQYAFLASFSGVFIGMMMMMVVGDYHGSVIQHIGSCVMIGSFFTMIFCGVAWDSNDTELYNNGLQTIQDSIDTTGDIPTQSALLCQMNDIDTRQCDLDMFDWYMDTHYDPTSNASMRVAMEMRGNVG